MNLDPEMRKSTLPHTYVLNPHFVRAPSKRPVGSLIAFPPTQISDVISTFFLVAQSLRTGEPLHEAQFKNLIDRLHYHSSYVYVPDPAASGSGGVSPHTKARDTLRQALTDYEYMSYATAVVGVLQLTHVSLVPDAMGFNYVER